MSEIATLLLGGDVMLGRGIDQVLPHPGEASLHEGYVRKGRGLFDVYRATKWRDPETG